MRKAKSEDHGWIVPRADGKRAVCGGPLAGCLVCRKEFFGLPPAQQAAWLEKRGLPSDTLDRWEDYPLGKQSE